MCYNVILPTTMDANQLGSDVNNLIYILNRWLKMLKNYGKLDEDCLNDDFIALAKVIKAQDVREDIKRAVKRCRDIALSKTPRIDDLTRALEFTLKLVCKTQESSAIKRVAKTYADQGMTERYRPLSKRLAKEKIRKIGREVIFTDYHTDDKETTRLVRRFVEKRAAQAVFRNSSKRDRQSNRYRQSVRRATSFSLYNKKYVTYNAQLRASGTHWRVEHHISKGEKILVAKHSYLSYEDALEAINKYMVHHPEDIRPLNAYLCDYCGKWHIGHQKGADLSREPEDLEIHQAS